MWRQLLVEDSPRLPRGMNAQGSRLLERSAVKEAVGAYDLVLHVEGDVARRPVERQRECVHLCSASRTLGELTVPWFLASFSDGRTGSSQAHGVHTTGRGRLRWEFGAHISPPPRNRDQRADSQRESSIHTDSGTQQPAGRFINGFGW